MALLAGRRLREAPPSRSLIGACTEDAVFLYTNLYFEIYSQKARLEISFENTLG